MVAERPGYCSIIVDETQDGSEVDQFSICAWYVNNDAEVCEDFLGFMKLEKIDTQSITDVMIPSLQWGLDFSLLEAQGYDGVVLCARTLLVYKQKCMQCTLMPYISNASHLYFSSHDGIKG